MITLDRSTIYLEKVTSQLGDLPANISDPMKKRETLAEYVYRVMQEEEIKSATQLQKRAFACGENISDSTINNILLGAPSDMRLSTIRALAIGLGRTLDEVLTVVLGNPVMDPGFSESELARIWELQQGLSAEDKKFYTRQLEVIVRDMQTTKRLRKKSE
jgi:transcriptional regulator with XRE-family HTH domain